MNGSYGLRPGGTQKVDAAADDSDEEEDEEPADHTFEFTTNLNVFRFLRMIVTLQVLGVMIDNDDIPVPVFFRIVCRGPLFYAIRFYSRPFMDLIYAIQVNQNNVPGASAGLAQGSALLRSGGSGGGASSHRRLSYWSSYREAVEPTPVFYPNIAFLTDRNWHTIQYYGHFFMGLFAVFMAGLFTFSFWELSDYTNRFEMERWLKRYATPKWWRVGGFNVMFAMMRGTLIMSLLVFFLYALCKQFVPKAVPETEMVGGAVALSLMLSFIVTLLALFLLWFANSAFQRCAYPRQCRLSCVPLTHRHPPPPNPLQLRVAERGVHVDHHPEEVHQGQGGDGARPAVVPVPARGVHAVQGVGAGRGLGRHRRAAAPQGPHALRAVLLHGLSPLQKHAVCPCTVYVRARGGVSQLT